MKPVRKLALGREKLTALTADELDIVLGGQATLLQLCATRITVLQYGCASDPRVCHYVTDFC